MERMPGDKASVEWKNNEIKVEIKDLDALTTVEP